MIVKWRRSASDRRVVPRRLCAIILASHLGVIEGPGSGMAGPTVHPNTQMVQGIVQSSGSIHRHEAKSLDNILGSKGNKFSAYLFPLARMPPAKHVSVGVGQMYAEDVNSISIQFKQIDDDICIGFCHSVECAENRHLEAAIEGVTEHFRALRISPRFSHSGKIDAHVLRQFVDYALEILQA
jgi:hypothetical protein